MRRVPACAVAITAAVSVAACGGGTGGPDPDRVLVEADGRVIEMIVSTCAGDPDEGILLVATGGGAQLEVAIGLVEGLPHAPLSGVTIDFDGGRTLGAFGGPLYNELVDGPAGRPPGSLGEITRSGDRLEVRGDLEELGPGNEALGVDAGALAIDARCTS